jgi:hypothetical protein
MMTPVEFEALDLAMKPSKSKEPTLYLQQPKRLIFRGLKSDPLHSLRYVGIAELKPVER